MWMFWRNSGLEGGQFRPMLGRAEEEYYIVARVALHKSYFEWRKIPNIEFDGEMPEDNGGPCREFFR